MGISVLSEGWLINTKCRCMVHTKREEEAQKGREIILCLTFYCLVLKYEFYFINNSFVFIHFFVWWRHLRFTLWCTLPFCPHPPPLPLATTSLFCVSMSSLNKLGGSLIKGEQNITLKPVKSLPWKIETNKQTKKNLIFIIPIQCFFW